MSDTYYTIINAWLFKNDKFAVILLVIMWPNDILHIKMENPF